MTPSRPRAATASLGTWGQPAAIGHRAVVDVAPYLFDTNDSEYRGTSARRLSARILHLPPGNFNISEITPDGDDWIGLLVLDGLLMVELQAGRAHTGWLIGRGDLIRPWDMSEISLTKTTAWYALEPGLIALLDRDFSMRAGGIPMLARAVVAKTAQTTNWLLAKSLVLATPSVEERLLLAFALLGERWGTVNHDGVLLRLPLTHARLATLCGVRRPSVTIALHSLMAAGLLSRTSEGHWLLRRRCGKDLPEQSTCWSQFAEALGLGPAPEPS